MGLSVPEPGSVGATVGWAGGSDPLSVEGVLVLTSNGAARPLSVSDDERLVSEQSSWFQRSCFIYVKAERLDFV